MMNETPLVSVNNLVKHYGGVVALDNMCLEVQPGTVHAVVGENGAGKSTLMKVLAGVVRPDSGSILLDGKPVAIDSPRAAREHGIGIVYQELSLFPHRSVLANLFVNNEPLHHRFFISHRAMVERSASLLSQLGLDLDVDAPLGSLTIGEQQLIELCRVLLEDPRLLILDEPNSALNEQETARLFAILQRLRERKITILYVSHRLEEVFAIADRVTVTRNGRELFTKDRAGLSIPEVIEGMIGTHQEALFPPRVPVTASSDSARLVVRNLSTSQLRDISCEVRSGEIVGLAGLEGSGVATLLGVLFGTHRAASGEIIYPDNRGLPANPTEAAKRGICLVPADRHRNGLMLEKSLVDNIAHVGVGAFGSNLSWLNRNRLIGKANRQISGLRIKAASSQALANELSGGNQQKVVIGKWLEVGPKVVLLDDPTRGVDVGAKREIYLLIRQLAADGRIVLFSSTELPELIGLCDRIIVLYRGRIAGELVGDDINNRDLLHLINTGEMAAQTQTIL
jgi:ribose transport system ATP-binding protein